MDNEERPTHRIEEPQKGTKSRAVASGPLTCPLCQTALTPVSGRDVGRCASCGRYYRREQTTNEYEALPYPPDAIPWRVTPKSAVASPQSAVHAPQRRSSLLREGAEKPCECGARLVFRHATERWQCPQCGAVEDAFI